jgi:short-chain fatty acids transporter
VNPATSAAIVSEHDEPAGFVARVGIKLTGWTERWVPDAFIFALLFTFVVVVAALGATTATLPQIVDGWGRGFWDLIPFTLQMALIVITGHVLASSRPMGHLIRALAAWPDSPRSAVALVSVVAMSVAWVHWGLSLMFSAMLAREIARRMDGVDYRALGAASFLGVGTIWAQGLSGSAVLQMATAGGLQPQVRDIVAAGGLVPGGLITLGHTIFLWQNLVAVLAEIAIVTAVMWVATPPRRHSRTARDLRLDLGEHDALPSPDTRVPTPGAWLEHSSILSWLVVALGVAYLTRYFTSLNEPLNAINLNTMNFAFLILGFALHRTPARLMAAVRAATPATWGIILQFPFYAGIAGIITATHLNDRIAAAFVSISTQTTFPAVVAVYSALLGVFVPSGGSKWVIEAPYVMAAAHALKVHLGWVVNAYGLGEALANLVQPFYMLPVLNLLGLSARDVMGYTLIVCLTSMPLVLALLILLGRTLPYPL